MVKNRISKVGVELEGGWDRTPSAGMVRDGSVKFPGHDPLPPPRRGEGPTAYTLRMQELRAKHGPCPKIVGEIPSPPLDPTEVPDFITKFYPKYVNETCGLHVHTSFPRKYFYIRLMDPKFQEAMFTALRLWAEEESFAKDHPIWERLSGEHRHCKGKFLADTQIRITRKNFAMEGPYDRHTAVNYHWFNTHTVECRLLPMFDTSEEAIRGVQRVLDTTNRFLAVGAKRDKPLRIVLPRHLPEHGGTINGYV